MSRAAFTADGRWLVSLDFGGALWMGDASALAELVARPAELQRWTEAATTAILDENNRLATP
jgi:hypothetical protein